MVARPKSTVVILDDEPRWCENYANFISRMPEAAAVRLEIFTDDALATAFTQQHADEIVGFIQDMNRAAHHEYTGNLEGARFLENVIVRYAPKARTLIVSGGIDQEAIRQVYISAGYQTDVMSKSSFDGTAFRNAFLWLLNVANNSLSVTAKPSVAPLPSVEVMELPWDEIRDHLAAHPGHLHKMNPRAFEKLVA